MNSENIKISNKYINLEISLTGAEIQSMTMNGKEYIWEGNPDVWEDKAPVLFPICGSLKDGKYTYEGNEYFLSAHGFAKDSLFEIERQNDNSVTLVLKSNSVTRKIYPFDFEFRITYLLDENTLTVNYDIKNLSNYDMYCSVGAHEGFACPEGIENYTVIFDKNEFLTTNNLEGPLLVNGYEIIDENVKVLPLKNKYFEIDAIIKLNPKSTKISLKHNDGTREIEYDFNGFDHLLIWSIPESKFVCIEPWCGLPDFVGTPYDISTKIGIKTIKPNEELNKMHKITIR